jgi:hypothetical protein
MGSYVDSFVTYNLHSMNIDFLGKTINCDIEVFIEKLLKTIDTETTIEWTNDMIKTALHELGKLLSVLFITYPTNSSLITRIKQTFL